MAMSIKNVNLKKIEIDFIDDLIFYIEKSEQALNPDKSLSDLLSSNSMPDQYYRLLLLRASKY